MRVWSLSAATLMAPLPLFGQQQGPAPSQSAELAPPPFADLATTPEQYALRARDKDRLTYALRAIKRLPDAIVATLPEASNAQVLLLGARDTPYRLNELVGLFPEVFTTLNDSSLLITLPVVVTPGATLEVSSTTTPVVRFASGGPAYATLVAVDATVTVAGSPQAPVTLTSYDPATTQADQDISDGRPYVVAFGGSMQFDHVISSSLGFLLGETSGVAWMPRQDRRPTGGARQSIFTRNYFGAYASGADGLVIAGSSFTENIVYGFDPHSGTNDTLVEDSIAERNGRHGFIFSADCHRNVIRNSQSNLNGGAGFVIDDGNDDAADPLRPSDNNTLDGVSATGNQATGIVIEGGSGNTVTGANLDGNANGVWVKNGASQTTITATSITNSSDVGIRLEAGTAATTVRDSTLSQAALGVRIDGAEGTALNSVSIDNSAVAAVSLAGDPVNTTFTDVTITGTGRAAVISPNTSSAESVAVDVTGVDLSGWSTGETMAASGRSYTAWLKSLPWILIVAVPAMLWVPFRWRWRRKQNARFRGAQ